MAAGANTERNDGSKLMLQRLHMPTLRQNQAVLVHLQKEVLALLVHRMVWTMTFLILTVTATFEHKSNKIIEEGGVQARRLSDTMMVGACF